MIHKRSTALEWSEKYFTGGLKLGSRRQPISNIYMFGPAPAILGAIYVYLMNMRLYIRDLY